MPTESTIKLYNLINLILLEPARSLSVFVFECRNSCIQGKKVPKFYVIVASILLEPLHCEKTGEPQVGSLFCVFFRHRISKIFSKHRKFLSLNMAPPKSISLMIHPLMNGPHGIEFMQFMIRVGLQYFFRSASQLQLHIPPHLFFNLLVMSMYVTKSHL